MNEVVLLANIARNEPGDTSTCPMGGLVAPVTVQQIIQAVKSALYGCGAPPINILDFGPVSGGGPGGRTDLPFELSANNIIAITMDVCFVDTVFDLPDCFSDDASVIINSAAVVGTCALGAGSEGMTLHIDVSGSGSQPLPTGSFMTCRFDVFSSASPGDYPVQLTATLTDSSAHMINDTASGMMRVFQDLGGPCQSDRSFCQAFDYCTDGVCCDSASCPAGLSCDIPGCEGACADPACVP